MTRYQFFGSDFGTYRTRARKAANRKDAAKILAEMKQQCYHLTVNVITDGGTETTYFVRHKPTERFFSPAWRS